MDAFKCLTGLQGTYKWSSTYDSDEHLILSNWKWTSVVKTVSNRIGRQRAVFCLSISESFAFSLHAAAKGQIILFSSSSPHLPYKQSSDKYERTLPFSQHNYIFPAPPAALQPSTLNYRREYMHTSFPSYHLNSFSLLPSNHLTIMFHQADLICSI